MRYRLPPLYGGNAFLSAVFARVGQRPVGTSIFFRTFNAQFINTDGHYNGSEPKRCGIRKVSRTVWSNTPAGALAGAGKPHWGAYGLQQRIGFAGSNR